MQRSNDGNALKLSRKATLSDHYYVFLVWVYLDIKICLDTAILAIDNSGRREYIHTFSK
jgi:hypothetical protein